MASYFSHEAMMTPPADYARPAIPADEQERLAALHQLNILDTPPVPQLDELTFLASEICQTPIALISLVDTNRQWFKSRHGLAATETPRDLAFCAHAIHETRPFIVEDALKDPRFRGNPLVQNDPKVRFYAGAQLQTGSGHNIGTLCVIDHQPKNLSPRQIAALETLARQVITTFERQLFLEAQQVALKTAMVNERKFRAVFDHAPLGIIKLDAEWRFVGVNAAFCQFIGYSAEELRGRSIVELTHPEDLAVTLELAADRARPKNTTIHLEKRYIHKDGHIVWGRVTARSVDLAGDEPIKIISVIEDYTAIRAQEAELKSAQAKMLSSSKMASLGEIAGGIAHEIYNPLAIINGKIEIMRRQATAGELNADKLDAALQVIRNTSERIVKIVKGLRAFSRDCDDDPMEVADVAAIIDSTLALCEQRFKLNNVDMRLEYSPGIQLECRPVQISQVLMNLLNNAFDAIESLPEKWVSIAMQTTATSVRIRVTDSGKGIPPKTVNKLMQPFFTTKEVGKGTGLGLSISKGICGAHHGQLYYDDRHANTSFVIDLPLVQPVPKSA